MNKKILLFYEKLANTLNEQTKTKTQGTPEYKINGRMETLSFSSPKNLIEEGKRLVAVTLTSFEATISIFKITDEKNSLSITTPWYWSSRGSAETTIEPEDFSRLRAQNDIELHVKEVRKRGNLIKTGDNEYKLSELDTHKNEIITEIKNLEYNDLEDMVFRMQ